MLKEYNGQLINALSEAVINNDIERVKYILDNGSKEEINSGVSPLYYISFRYLLDKELYNVKKEIFDMILNHPNFENINNDIVESSLISYPLLHHFLQEAGLNKYSEECALAIINSKKYKRINDIDGPKALISAIYGNYDFTEQYKYSFACVKALIDHPEFNGIGNHSIPNSMNPNYKMSPIDVPTITKETIEYILTSPKFTGDMLVSNLKKIRPRLSDAELYEVIGIKGLTDDVKIRDNIILNALMDGDLGMISALIYNENITFSEEFYDQYFNNIRNNLVSIHDEVLNNKDEIYYRTNNEIKNIYREPKIIDFIINGIDYKHLSQINNGTIDIPKAYIKS